jgi:hypothetical protein
MISPPLRNPGTVQYGTCDTSEDVSRLTRDASSSEVLRMEPDGVVAQIRPRTEDDDGVK